MATLSSPGVSVTVIDESFYTPAAPGTVPLVIVASAENKQNGAGTGIAPGTLKANAGKVWLLTSQKDLSDTFGTPVFKTDANNNPIHAGEQNEYGLQAAYSLLGVSNRAYVVRADVNVNDLNAAAAAPKADPDNGTYWLDTANTSWGVFEWNGSPRTATNGQTFTNKTLIVITEQSKVVNYSGSNFAPKGSIGAIGDYAIVALADLNTAYKDADKLYFKNRTGSWVQVGTSAWASSWPTATGTVVNPAITQGHDYTINGTTITASGTTLQSLVDQINGNTPLQTAGITAAKVNGKLELYSATADIVTTGTHWAVVGLTTQTYSLPALSIARHTQVPQWKNAGTGQTARPTGSVWIKSTEPNDGARWRTKRYNSATDTFESVSAPLYATGQSAIAALDPTGGGDKIAAGALFVKTNEDEGTTPDASFRIFRKSAVGYTTIKSAKINTQFTAGVYTFSIKETLVGQDTFSSAVQISFTATHASSDADLFASAINSAGLVNIEAEVDSQNRINISHKLGGDFLLQDVTTNYAMTAAGFSGYNSITEQGTQNLYDAADGVAHKFLASLWEPLRYTASSISPSTLTADGKLWYSSVVDEVDIMVHNGSRWVGYLASTSPFYDADPTRQTDPNGPIVSATVPLLQSDGTALMNGDIWIDTSDIENYPLIYKFDANKPNTPIANRWTLVNNADQTTEDGVLFHDARWGVAGSSVQPASIVDLLSSNYLDPDAPDPALYPKGMLLWNLRRSGFNVKKFHRNYVDLNEDNLRAANHESMANYYPHRWVSEAANQEDGSGTFGRKAQRKVVVQALQATVNANQQIRDEEARVFNLIATPGYPELIGEMISLNYDRGLTAFVVADTPARLTPDATSLSNWGNNVALALEDNDLGAASFDEYMAMFYPWGYTSDNLGNNVVVPPSHMMLRTIALSDNVSYPWFAPAGTRRGGITNATAVGYIDSTTGEFNAVALNTGQRDTLYDVKVNPITFLTGVGLVNYGQKTRARNASALDRINVARLVVYLRRQLSVLAKPYIFEPNDKITRDEIKNAVESLLLELAGQRALYDYIVVCDSSNNTPSRIDRNELYVDVAIEPVKAVEFIYIPLRLKNTGEIAGL